MWLEFTCITRVYIKNVSPPSPGGSRLVSFTFPLSFSRALPLLFYSRIHTIANMRATTLTLIAAATLAAAQTGSIPSCMYCKDTMGKREY